jgi:polysaccharide pyruvyl transferase WcaK-like protein
MSKVKNKLNIVILGAYGQENIGDEAMLQILLENLKDLDVVISCNSMNPAATKERFGIDAFFTGIKKDFWKKVKVFFCADVVVYGGGALLVELRMSHMNKRVPLYRGLLVNLFCRLLFKKIVYIGVSVENLPNSYSKFLARVVASLSDLFIVRDLESKILLHECGFKQALLSSDLVMATEFQGKKSDAFVSKRICIFPVYRIPAFNLYYGQYIQNLAEFADRASSFGYHVEFYPMRTEFVDKKNDTFVIREIRRLVKSKNVFFRDVDFQKEINKFAKYVSTFDVVLSSRFHGLVYAFTQKVKTVISLSEFRKNEALMSEFLSTEFALSSAEVNVDIMFNLVQEGDKKNVTSERDEILQRQHTMTIQSIKKLRSFLQSLYE